MQRQRGKALLEGSGECTPQNILKKKGAIWWQLVYFPGGFWSAEIAHFIRRIMIIFCFNESKSQVGKTSFGNHQANRLRHSTQLIRKDKTLLLVKVLL